MIAGTPRVTHWLLLGTIELNGEVSVCDASSMNCRGCPWCLASCGIGATAADE